MFLPVLVMIVTIETVYIVSEKSNQKMRETISNIIYKRGNYTKNDIESEKKYNEINEKTKIIYRNELGES